MAMASLFVTVPPTTPLLVATFELQSDPKARPELPPPVPRVTVTALPPVKTPFITLAGCDPVDVQSTELEHAGAVEEALARQIRPLVDRDLAVGLVEGRGGHVDAPSEI